MEPEGSLPHLQVPATCPYPEHKKHLRKQKVCIFSYATYLDLQVGHLQAYIN